MINPDNVPRAAVLLGEYAVEFADLESECNFTDYTLQGSINALQHPRN